MRILIAEDESELAKGLKFLLEKNKFSVDIAADGAEALDYFCGGNYDVIILDIMMPKMNGLEVLRSIRRTGANVPILMLTAKAEIEDRRMSLRPVFLRYTAICPGKLRGFPETIFLRWMKKRRKPIRKRYF